MGISNIQTDQVRRIALLSMFTALLVVGRIYFAFIPNVQPVTAIIIIISFTFGMKDAIIVTTLSTLITNLYLGTGIWTLWQIGSWAFIAVISGLIGRWYERIPSHLLALYAGLCGLIYGFIVSIPSGLAIGNFWAYYIAGITFDITHANGNILFFYVLYPILTKLFKRYIRI